MLLSPLVLLLTWIRLRRDGFRETLSGLEVANERDGVSNSQLAQARSVARSLKLAIRVSPWRPKCLVRALSLGWYLARLGIPFVVRIGVPAQKYRVTGFDNGDFSAHAWVECDGVVLNDRQDIANEFTAFQDGPESV